MSLLENAGATGGGKNMRLCIRYQWIIRRIRISPWRISRVHSINISKNIRAQLGANRRDKNCNIRRCCTPPPQLVIRDVNGFIISRCLKRAGVAGIGIGCIYQEAAQNREKRSVSCCEGDGRERDTDSSFNPAATLGVVALNSTSPLYPDRLSVFDLCNEARETPSDNAAANIVNDNLTAFRPTPARSDSFGIETRREVRSSSSTIAGITALSLRHVFSRKEINWSNCPKKSAKFLHDEN